MELEELLARWNFEVLERVHLVVVSVTLCLAFA